MILSVSRRTDIPNYYADWFLNRIKGGYLYVRNPMNARQVSRIVITPELVDCIVFWTKNPQPMLSRLKELEPYPYYFQFTLTGYAQDIERNVPYKKKCMLPIFQELSRKIGKGRVIWRYDPILFTDKYTPEYHLQAFGQIAESLQGYTARCVISFVDMYAKIQRSMNTLNLRFLTESELTVFGKKLASIAADCGIQVASCAEEIDLAACGIAHNACIDKSLVEQITGYRIHVDKDKNQRKECGCVESIEVGTYNTCKNGCLYCYANYSQESVLQNSRFYDADSPLLCGRIMENDRITERKIKSLRELS